MSRENIRLALPSKGRLSEQAFHFLDQCGFSVYRPNSRQYIANIPSHPHVQVILQRPGDIAIGVREGSLDFGITGFDMLSEKNHGAMDKILVLHDELGFGACHLSLAAPDALEAVQSISDLRTYAVELAQAGKQVRIATKFPGVTADFLDKNNIQPYKLIDAEGTLEIAPTIGYADVIVDLVSSGMTLRDNHLHELEDGVILRSQACLAANRSAVVERPEVMALARSFLEYIEAYLRAKNSYMVIANMRGDSAEIVAEKIFAKTEISGLQGPTIAPVFTRNNGDEPFNWYSVSLAVQKQELTATIAALRSIGGSGVIVTPATYIFEEEPKRYRAMLAALELDK